MVPEPWLYAGVLFLAVLHLLAAAYGRESQGDEPSGRWSGPTLKRGNT